MLQRELARRFSALLIDWVLILLYGALLLGGFLAFYFWRYQEIPLVTETSSHLLAFFTMTLPVVLYCTWSEAHPPYMTSGKRKQQMEVHHQRAPLRGSIIRNIGKFLPWQLGHMSVIRGMFQGFEGVFVWVTYGLAIFLPILYIGMVLFRKDHRHLPDLLAGTKVRPR